MVFGLLVPAKEEPFLLREGAELDLTRELERLHGSIDLIPALTGLAHLVAFLHEKKCPSAVLGIFEVMLAGEEELRKVGGSVFELLTRERLADIEASFVRLTGDRGLVAHANAEVPEGAAKWWEVRAKK